MLTWLSIQGLALVESIELEFAAGLNVLTGETGAGKSLILGSIGLLLGERADAAWIRPGVSRGFVEGAFDLSGRPDLESAMAALEVEVEEHRVALRRELFADGRSRALVNGRTVLVGRLRSIGDLLVDLHGQHEHQHLLRPERQTDFFDEWAGLLEERRSIETERRELDTQTRAVAEARAELERDREREKELREDHEELRAAALVEGEESELKRARELLMHRDRQCEALAAARDALENEEGGAAGLLRRASKGLRSAAGLDQALEPLAVEAAALTAQAADLAARTDDALRSLLEGGLDAESLERRLDLLHRLKRKHATDHAGLIALEAELEATLRRMTPEGDELAARARVLDERRAALSQRLDALLGERRARQAPFERAIGERLGRLGFGRAALHVAMAPRSADRPAIDPLAIPGLEFRFQPNPGEPERPLRRIASGGELSRVMLAVKSIMAERDQVGVLVFDEVDQGIGGAVAEEVGRLLRSVGERRQVLCITHLPLLAAHGARHFVVTKSTTRGRTRTSVRILGSNDREAEIARLLAGERITDTTHRQARELLRAANAEERATGRRRVVESGT